MLYVKLLEHVVDNLNLKGSVFLYTPYRVYKKGRPFAIKISHMGN